MMDRSRSKRYHYDHDSDSQTPPPPPPSLRSKPQRFDNRRPPFQQPPPPHRPHRSSSSDRRPPSPPSSQQQNPSSNASSTTFFQILCPDIKVGSIIGKNGSIISNFRRETGAWINVHALVPGDDERIIETSDNRKREPDGRPPVYSPAQEALLMVHERILDSDFGEVDRDEGWARGGAGGGRGDRDGKVTTRLVVPRLHVGCLLGKGGKIIEQMRMETRTHIRILPRDDYTPRCVSMAEEIVQVVGEGNCVKRAVAIISARLKESLHRDRGPFRRLQAQDDFFPPDDEFTSGSHHQMAMEGLDLESRSSMGQSRARNSSYSSHLSGYAVDSDADSVNERPQSLPFEDLVFRILCPNSKVENIMGASDGIIDMLRTDIGVDVMINDPVPGSGESVIIVTAEEAPDDDLFPAQEALLHIQTQIVDLGPDKDNIITTRLLIPAGEIGFLEGSDGSLSEIQRLTNANVQILPKEDLPPCALEADELIQIVGEIRAARNALVQVTAKLRSHLYRDISTRDISTQRDMLPPSISAPSHTVNGVGTEPSSVKSSPREAYQSNDPPSAVSQNTHTASFTWQPKDNGDSSSASHEQKESNVNDEGRQSGIKRFSAPIVTKSTLEVVIPKYAIQSLLMRSGSKLALISEMSGASVSLIEDQPDQTEKVVQISGTPEQSERAQSLLQGFILSTQDDIPSS